MELKELTEKTLEIFEAEDVSKLGSQIMKSMNDNTKKEKFIELVENDLSKDWLQMIYQYYLADREDKKQDYTPKSIAKLMGELVGKPDVCIDMCAGSGALTIQKWIIDKKQKFILYELDENVIPYLLFNLSVRNIEAMVYQADILKNEIYGQWQIKKGEKFANVVNIKSAI